MKEEKYGLTGTEWFLSIIGIILLACVIILPPVFRTVFKEEEKEPVLPDEIVIGTIKCLKDNITELDYTYTETLNFTYYNDSIQQYSLNSKRIYNDSVIYLNDKQLFGKYTTAFSILSGYNYSVDPDDDTYTLIIDEKFNLDEFEETTITIPGDNETTSIKSKYTKNDSIEQIKNNLVSNGYICE